MCLSRHLANSSRDYFVTSAHEECYNSANVYRLAGPLGAILAAQGRGGAPEATGHRNNMHPKKPFGGVRTSKPLSPEALRS